MSLTHWLVGCVEGREKPEQVDEVGYSVMVRLLAPHLALAEPPPVKAKHWSCWKVWLWQPVLQSAPVQIFWVKVPPAAGAGVKGAGTTVAVGWGTTDEGAGVKLGRRVAGASVGGWDTAGAAEGGWGTALVGTADGGWGTALVGAWGAGEATLANVAPELQMFSR